MAKAVRISVSSVQLIWRAHGLRPHLIRRLKLSNDPQFARRYQNVKIAEKAHVRRRILALQQTRTETSSTHRAARPLSCAIWCGFTPKNSSCKTL
jgi:hypothetical protein